eukprot:gene1945-2214_t
MIPPAFGDTAKPSTSKEMSFVEKVEKLAEMVDDDLRLVLNRDEIRKSGLTFYTTGQVRLRKNLQVEFEGPGELGVVGRALRAEYFPLLFKEVNWRLFEGEGNLRTTHKGCDNLALFKLAGSMMSHAIM